MATISQPPIFQENPLSWPDAKSIPLYQSDTEKTIPIYQCDSGKHTEEFRNYVNSQRQKKVEEFYKLQHTHQTLDYVLSKRKQYLTFDKCEMSVWDCLIQLDDMVDDSDPDIEESQLQHALMTAEAIRKKYPAREYEWLRVVGLIHDIGKILSVKWNEPQWAVVGDTFPVGCQFSSKCVFYEHFRGNADFHHPVYSTLNGIYTPHCGLDHVMMSWGHDEYLYQVCKYNKCTLPPEGLAIIRYHSFYPWHREGGYRHLMCDDDVRYYEWVKEFNQFDLYSKGDRLADVDALCEDYQAAILRYFPKTLKW